MEFTVEMVYENKIFPVAARAFRKTVFRKKRRRSYLFAATFLVLLLFPLSVEQLPMLFFALSPIALIFLFEDHLLGWLNRVCAPTSNRRIITVFRDTQLCASTVQESMAWNYDEILNLVEASDCFILILGEDSALVYIKQQLQSIGVEEFRAFLLAKTGKDFIRI